MTVKVASSSSRRAKTQNLDDEAERRKNVETAKELDEKKLLAYIKKVKTKRLKAQRAEPDI